MALYHINEGTLDLPDDWADRTMHIFSENEGPQPEWNIVVSRDRLPEGEGLDEYLTRQLGDMRKALRHLKVVREEESALDGVPARELEVTWVGDRGTVRQRQVVAVRQGRSLVFTLTVADYLYSRHAHVLDELLADFKFRSG